MKHEKIDSSNNTGTNVAAKGTTAQRPSTPVSGEWRYNTDSNSMEWYNGSSWDSPAGGTSIKHQASFNIANTTAGGALSGTCFAIKVIPEGDISVSNMDCFITNSAASTVYMGVYNAAGDTLLCEASGSTAATGLQRFATDVTVNLTGGTEYWFAILEGAGAANFGSKAVFNNSMTAKSGFVSATPSAMPSSIAGFASVGTGYYIAAGS